MEGQLEPYYVGICMLGEEIGVLFFRVNSSYVCLWYCVVGPGCVRYVGTLGSCTHKYGLCG